MSSCVFLLLSLLFSLACTISSYQYHTRQTNDNGNISFINETRNSAVIPGIEQEVITPCNTYTRVVNISIIDLLLVNNTFTSCNNKTTRDAVFRIWTYSGNVTDRKSLVFVTRDENNVQTWKLPLQLQGIPTRYNSAYRTICSTVFLENNRNERVIAMYIDAFTSSSEELEYEIKIEPVDNIVLSLNESVGFYVAANAPQMYYFKFPKGHSNVRVLATSTNTTGCVIVSVQNSTCPVNDLLQNARSKGVYQTMIMDATVNVEAHHTVEGDDFFVVIVVAKPSLCHSNNFVPSDKPIYIQLVIQKEEPASQYKLAIIAPLILFIGLGVIVVIIVSFPCFHITFYPFVCSRSCCVFKTCITKETTDTEELNNQSEEIILGSEEASINYETLSTKGSYSSGEVRKLLDENEESIRLPNLLKKPIPELQKQYSVYGWNTFTVGIFYGLPAFQLVLAGQLSLDSTGDQDICYYNFECSRPLGALSSFNSVWSNISFIILGLTFIVIVGIRHYKAKQEKLNDPRKYYTYGIPHFFGIYYALGVALIMEGFMSAFYHICPSNNNYEFDTAFMYIICGLLILKIFQTRHPDVHANAFIAFLCFGVVIFLTLIGIYEESHLAWLIRLVLILIVIFSIVLFSFSFYFYHDWHISIWLELTTYKRIWGWLKSWCIPCNSHENCNKLKPRHLSRSTKLVIMVIINAILGLLLILFSKKSIAIVVLGLLITNFIFITFIYVLSKLWYKEPLTLMPIIFLFILGGCWFTGIPLLLNIVANRKVTPAESRQYNEDCRILDFYDIHDIWHFVSAAALFFTFLFVFTLDDGLKERKRDTIKVF